MTAYGPYSPVRKAGDYYFISGQVGINPATKQAASSVKAQTRQVLANLDVLLISQGLSRADVIKTTVFLKNMQDFAVCNELYTDFFPEPRPARSCVEVSSLPAITATPLLIELEAVAYKPYGHANDVSKGVA